MKEINRIKSTEQPNEGIPEQPGRNGLSGEVTSGARTKDGQSWSWRELGKSSKGKQADGSRTSGWRTREEPVQLEAPGAGQSRRTFPVFFSP